MNNPWWVSSNSKHLREKTREVRYIRKASEYFSLPDLTKVILMKDGNMAGNYFRFFGFFLNDPERYFNTFRDWDIETEWTSLEVEQQLTVNTDTWKVVKIDNDGYLVEFEKL